MLLLWSIVFAGICAVLTLLCAVKNDRLIEENNRIRTAILEILSHRVIVHSDGYVHLDTLKARIIRVLNGEEVQ